ncbi:hypothetical protein [Bacillus nitratireducens]|uniref:YokE-like PH domain-containing protein n=1 Tax=Bacillus nitratireducens TaxID=2026193 RepID=A0ABU6P653_9BACI|nr:hypothetical protein [Bacillus nitratireducens]EJS52258.1 hypothetical protein ICG_04204 [Bacillus cereus BAG1X1-3]EOO79490.1 hypothetical protein IC7_00561 [Bacillus cereus BAG1O-1]PEX49443.1 hypothetical protein CN464_08715 [Bacillus cereus]MDR4170345.1 hypothetical protein [Bacillus nitratireducens]MED4676779.1 hypothetical protein [Bacillus nitratireducens]
MIKKLFRKLADDFKSDCGALKEHKETMDHLPTKAVLVYSGNREFVFTGTDMVLFLGSGRNKKLYLKNQLTGRNVNFYKDSRISYETVDYIKATKEIQRGRAIKLLPLLFVPVRPRGSFTFSGVAKLLYFIPFIVPMLMYWKVTTSRWRFYLFSIPLSFTCECITYEP